MINTDLPLKVELSQSLKEIVQQLEEEYQLTPSSVRNIIQRAKVSQEDLTQWAAFDHPVEDSYGRRVVYHGDNFEIMVMSWCPGDFSTIHDHGHTQWGAVQVFGPAEHATFKWRDGYLTTLNRWTLGHGEVIAVGHDLIHQMGNPTEDIYYMSLHVYGDLVTSENVTGDSRIFDLETGTIQIVDGGVFFALPREQIKSIESGMESDFPTRLRHLIELTRRLIRMEDCGLNNSGKNLEEVINETFSDKHLPNLLLTIRANSSVSGDYQESRRWKLLVKEIAEAAKLQDDLGEEFRNTDNHINYAKILKSLL